MTCQSFNENTQIYLDLDTINKCQSEVCMFSQPPLESTGGPNKTSSKLILKLTLTLLLNIIQQLSFIKLNLAYTQYSVSLLPLWSQHRKNNLKQFLNLLPKLYISPAHVGRSQKLWKRFLAQRVCASKMILAKRFGNQIPLSFFIYFFILCLLFVLLIIATTVKKTKTFVPIDCSRQLITLSLRNIVPPRNMVPLR